MTAQWWFDGSDLQSATVLGWWDGDSIEPVEVLGWWNGTTIQALEQAASPSPSYSDLVISRSPLGYWKLDEASGTVAADSSGNARAGTYENPGSIAYSQSSLVNTDGSAIKVTTGGRVRIPAATWMNTPTFSVEAWSTAENATTGMAIASRAHYAVSFGGDWSWLINYTSTGKFEAGVFTSAGYQLNSALGSYTVGPTYHTVLTYDGSMARFYLDGVLLWTSTALGGTPHASATVDIVLGGNDDGSNAPHTGKLDEVVYYGTALTDEQVLENYNAGYAPPPPPPTTPTFIQSGDQGGNNGATLAAHASAQAGDRQILTVATHASVTPATPSGWTLLARHTSTHNSLTFFTRLLDAGNVGTGVSVTWADVGRANMRTYRACGGFNVIGNGLGLASPAMTFTGRALRVFGDAQPNTSGGGTKLWGVPAGLGNVVFSNYNWYDGILIGDDVVTTSPAPARTATTNNSQSYPQYVNIDLLLP